MSKTVSSATSICDLPLRSLNLFLLNKLYLLDNSPDTKVVEIAERLVGFHAKRPQPPYLSVYARNGAMHPSHLNAALYEDRTLLRAHCMRGTVHMLPLSQYRTVLSATDGQLDGMYRRAFEGIANKEDIEKAALEMIEKRGPISHADIASDLKMDVGERDLYLILNGLCTRGVLVKATVNGSWRSSVYNYDLLERWQPVIPEGESDPAKARSKLIEWYLSSYGPSTLADVAWWSGLSQSQVKKALANIDRPHSYLHFESLGADALIFDDDLAALNKWSPPARPQAKLLPGFDPYVMAYIDRGRYIGSEHYGKVFKKVSGIIEPVILVDGWIVGTWKYSLVRGKLAYEVFSPSSTNQINKAINEAIGQTEGFIVRADSESMPTDFLDREV